LYVKSLDAGLRRHDKVPARAGHDSYAASASMRV
jgi:hypothetical protein